MVGVARYPPNYDAAMAQNQVAPGQVTTSIGIREGTELSIRVVGLMQGVNSYGGAML